MGRISDLYQHKPVRPRLKTNKESEGVIARYNHQGSGFLHEWSFRAVVFEGCKLKRGNTVGESRNEIGVARQLVLSIYNQHMLLLSECDCWLPSSPCQAERERLLHCSSSAPVRSLISPFFFSSHLPFVFFIHLSVCCHTTHLQRLLLPHHSRQVIQMNRDQNGAWENGSTETWDF